MGNRTPKTPAHGRPAKSESGHGPKTHERNIEQLESGPTEASREERFEQERARGAASGRRRLVEDREQHDEAEKNSEKTRLARDSQRHSHDVDTQEGDSGISHNAKRKS